jgi:diguanylate cyclase (GGDEF)-like protein
MTFVVLNVAIGSIGLLLALALAVLHSRAQGPADESDTDPRAKRRIISRLIDGAGATLPTALGVFTAAVLVAGSVEPSPGRDALAATIVAGAFIASMVSIGPVGSRDPLHVATFSMNVVAFGLLAWVAPSPVMISGLLVVTWVAALFTFSWRIGAALAGLSLVAWIAPIAYGAVSLGQQASTDGTYVAAVGGALAAATAASLELTRRRQHNLVSRLSVDPVTSLHTRLQLELVFWRELTRSMRFGRVLSILMIDLDGLKQVNDNLGHQAGDRLLLGVGRAIRNSVRASDFAARFGGDEFVVILPETGPAGAEVIANVVRRKVSEVRIRSGSRETAGSASIGVASFPEDGATSNDLLAQADARMYADKSRRGIRR